MRESPAADGGGFPHYRSRQAAIADVVDSVADCAVLGEKLLERCQGAEGVGVMLVLRLVAPGLDRLVGGVHVMLAQCFSHRLGLLLSDPQRDPAPQGLLGFQDRFEFVGIGHHCTLVGHQRYGRARYNAKETRRQGAVASCRASASERRARYWMMPRFVRPSMSQRQEVPTGWGRVWQAPREVAQ